ncbi:MAG TPA: hypothetical protein VFP19_04460 [Candidatus Limnocylindrales bacterium]|nr:hypothetical protein [Candidatus Limnocylindrales bacterium]
MLRRSSRLVAAATAFAAVAVLAVASTPSGVLAGSLVPFHLTVSETFTAAPCGPSSRCITAVGSGEATHLGAVSEHATVVVDTNPADAQGGCAPEARTTTLTAANGDTVTMTGSGWSCPTGDAHDDYVITGGSGRFQGASGSGSEVNSHTFTGPGVGVASVTYDGTISSVGSLDN